MTRMSKAASIRVGGILGGVGVLFVGGVLIASAPAFADNGPHVSMTNTNLSGSQAGIGGALGGGCASCHRAHTAKATEMLLKTSDEVALCESCHGGTGNGATTDVFDGVAYNGKTGALRGGGFSKAAIDSGAAVRGPGTYSAPEWRINKTQNAINVLGTPATATSQHSVGSPTTQTMWGNGAFAASANYGAPGVTLECSSCHDPHGNGNFRILNPVPSDSGVVLPAITTASSTGTTIKYILAAAYPLNVGQTVTVTGNSNADFNVTQATVTAATAMTPADGSFKVLDFSVVVGTAPATTSGTGGSVSPVFPDVKVATPAPEAITSAAYTTVDRKLAFTLPTGTNKLPYGAKVTVTGNSNADFNVTDATIVASTTSSFAVLLATAPASAAGTGGSAQGAAVDYNYTTTNYWVIDPNAQAPSNASGNSSFIVNSSQWCSTCHTRYLSTGSSGRTVNTGDAVFTYRHTSANNKGQDNPNCLQCHVAHGTNAAMSGTSDSSAADSPGAAPTDGDHSSKLLRVNNRGVCQMCHNK